MTAEEENAVLKAAIVECYGISSGVYVPEGLNIMLARNSCLEHQWRWRDMTAALAKAIRACNVKVPCQCKDEEHRRFHE